MTDELKIKISGDLTDLEKGLSSADKNINSFAKKASGSANQLSNSLDKTTTSSVNLSNATEMSADEIAAWDAAARRNSMEQYGNDVKRTTKDVNNLASAQRNLGGSANTLGKQIRGTNTVAIEFSRIIQDAPYGVIGVGNNITQLTQNFANLQKQTGSTGKALRVAFSSMFQGANLLVLGISLATTAFTLYNMRARESKNETDDLNESTKRFIDTLHGVARARAEGTESAQKDITNLRLLYEATQDTTLAIEDRRKAAKELIDQYPKQFAGMNEEAILVGEAVTAYNQLSKSLLATAQAMAAVDRVRENSNKILNNRLEILKLQNEANEIANDIADRERTLLVEQQSGQQGIVSQQALSRLEGRRAEILEQINQLGEEAGSINEENIQIQQEYNRLIGEGADLSGNLDTNLEKGTKKRKEAADKLAEALVANEERVQAAIREGRDKEIEAARIRYENLYKLAGDNAEARVQIAAQEAEEITAINKKFDEKDKARMRKKEAEMLAELDKQNAQIEKKNEAARKKREKAEKDLAKRIYETQKRYADQLGGAVGNALEDALGRGENFFKALADEFKRTLIRMAADAAAAQIGKAILSGINSSSGGGGGFNLGGFIGNVINWGSKIFGSGSGFSSGNFPTGNFGGGNFPTTNPVKGGGFAPGIMSSNKPINVNVTGALRGQDIMVSNNRAVQFNSRFNGGQ